MSCGMGSVKLVRRASAVFQHWGVEGMRNAWLSGLTECWRENPVLWIWTSPLYLWTAFLMMELFSQKTLVPKPCNPWCLVVKVPADEVDVICAPPYSCGTSVPLGMASWQQSTSGRVQSQSCVLCQLKHRKPAAANNVTSIMLWDYLKSRWGLRDWQPGTN